MQQYSIACGLCIIFKYEEQSLLGITYGKSALCSQGEISSLEELMEPPGRMIDWVNYLRPFQVWNGPILSGKRSEEASVSVCSFTHGMKFTAMHKRLHSGSYSK